jgi:hypothetical protein
MSGLEREAQNLQRQKQEITNQVHTRHDTIVTWAGWARDEVIYMDKNLFYLWPQTVSAILSEVSLTCLCDEAGI